MESIIKIKCPHCGAVLSVKNQAGIETKNVTCPICKQMSPFSGFRPVADYAAEERTRYPGSEEHPGTQNSGPDTVGSNFTLGRLKVLSSGKKFQLKPGRNVVGRQADNSTADIQIPTEGSKRMSREHLIIEVRKVPGKGFVHYASLCKEKVNATFVNDAGLEYGDCVVLHHGDIIKLPDSDVKFEIPDEEGTDF